MDTTVDVTQGFTRISIPSGKGPTTSTSCPLDGNSTAAL